MHKKFLRGISGLLVFVLLTVSLCADVTLAADMSYKSDYSAGKDEVHVIDGEEIKGGDKNSDYHLIDANTSIINDEHPSFFSGPFAAEAGLPTKFDSRNDHNITSVKNQGAYGTCWAHAAINAAEASYLKNNLFTGSKIEASQTVNFSELAFGYNYYHRQGQNDVLGNTLGDYTEGKYTATESPSKALWYNRGGNNRMTSFYMVNWEAPANEDNYNKYENVNTKTIEAERYFDSAIHVQDARFFSSSSMDYTRYISAVKQHVMDQGSVMLSYYSDTNNYLGNTMYATYVYCPIKYDNGSNSKFKPNHAVSIIGWDDDIAKENFKATYNGQEYTPKYNGAWLVKNSWGNSRQANGYFWLSYEDKSIEDVIGIRVESKDNYDNIVYYDGGTGVNSYSASKGVHNYNIFTNNTGEPQVVKAGGFAINTSAPESGIKYCMQVYKNRIPGNPESGMPMLDTPVTGTVYWAGYYTIKFPADIRINNGESYSIDVWFPENDKVSLFVDKDSDYSWIANHTAGKSKVSYHGDFDLYKQSETDNSKNNYATIRIKSYVDHVAANISGAKIICPDTIYYDESGNAFNPQVMYDGALLERDKDYEIIEISGNAGRPGDYRVRISGIGKYTGEIIYDYTIQKAKVVFSALSAKIVSGNCIDNYKYQVSGYKKNIPENIVKISCSANSLSLPGTYPIKINVADGFFAQDCYEIICIDGQLTILNTVKQDEVLYTVSFNGMGVSENPANQYVPFDGHAIEPTVNVEGMKIIGWYEDPDFVKQWDFETSSPKGYDLMLYAKWDEIKYSIRYNKNINVGSGDIPVENMVYSQKTQIKSEKMYEGLEEYLFTGWNTKADGSGTMYYPGQIVTGKILGVTRDNEEIQLYAQWNAKVDCPEFAPLKTEYVYGDKISIATRTEGADIYYSIMPLAEITEAKPTIKDIKYTDEIIVTGNMCIRAVAVKEGYVDSEVAELLVYMENEQGDILEEDLEKYCKDGIPHEIWVAGYPVEEDAFVYDGKTKTFDVRVYDYNVLLKKGVDYTYKFKNNRNACEDLSDASSPYVEIKGIGNYKGVVRQKFIIRAKDIGQETEVSEFYSPEVVYPFNGKIVNFVPELYQINGKKMKAGKDFEYHILNSSGKEITSPAVAGTYTVVINGIKNYCGSRKVLMHIVNDPQDMKNSTVKGVLKKVSYDNGNEIYQPLLKVYNPDGKLLTENIDYKISYLNNKNVGKAIILIEGIGGTFNIYGTKVVTFEIKGISLKNYKVEKFWDEESGEDYPYIYNGQEITVPVNVYQVINDEDEGVESYLQEDIDYTVEYKNNINAGKGQVIIKGCGNYAGTIKRYFKIKRADIMEASIEYNDVIGYQKGGAKPEVKVYFDDTELVKKQDYVVSYKNNKKINDRSDENELNHPYIIVKGKGNYCGTMHDPEMPYTFEITAKSFYDSENTVSANAADVVASDKPGKWRSKLVVKDSNGKTLKEGVDYTKPVYTRADDGTALYDEMTIPAGTRINVTAEGLGNYKDSVSANYRVVNQSVAGVRVLLDSKVYDSDGVAIEPDDLIVLEEGCILKYGVDYKIEQILNNTKKGRAYVVIRGLGKYGGTKKVSFKITPKEIGLN